jgi:hypothetical protein
MDFLLQSGQTTLQAHQRQYNYKYKAFGIGKGSDKKRLREGETAGEEGKREMCVESRRSPVGATFLSPKPTSSFSKNFASEP